MTNITAAILILLSVGLFFGYVNPTYGGTTGSSVLAEKSIKELKIEQANYVDALSKAHEIETARTGLLEKYNAIPKDDLDKLVKLLPDHVDSVRLIIDINNIAAAYGMTLKNITLIDDKETPAPAASSIGPTTQKYASVGLRFSVSGTYDNFRTFLHDLEQSLRIIDVTTIGFSVKPESDTYEYALTVGTYRLK